ncbi:MAG: DUF2231 domain-containing protein [Terriglobia bacterium]|nr:DUF2231 domain-containing protein [Terriglobia bacterium]
MSPFDLKSVVLARHAQHVVLIHFPIALFTTAVAFDFLWQWTQREEFAIVTYLNLLLAAATTLPTVVSGLLAWRWALEGQQLKGVLLVHLLLGTSATAVVLFVAWIHTIARRAPRTALPGYRLAIEFTAVMLIAATAHLGGILTGVNGPY